MAEHKSFLSLQTIIMLMLFIVIVPMLPLLISWQWDWWEAWLYAGVNILGFGVSRFLANRRHPDLLAERGKSFQHKNPEPWDKKLSPLLGLFGGFIPFVAGLDARFGPSAEFGLVVKIAALLFLVGGYVLGSYALIANRFFSGVVRIQSERDHHVVTTGPYRWMRHPGYAGAVLSYLVTPFLLDSMWAFIPVLLTLGVIVIRTHFEDKTLLEKLDGYREYTQEVPYRLIPGIW